MGDQSLAHRGIQVAIAHQRAAPGEADLTAVGVTREDDVRTVGGETVQRAHVRRVRHADAHVGRPVLLTREARVPVEAQVGVVHAGEVDDGVRNVEPLGAVDEPGPAAFVERAVHVLGGQPRGLVRFLAARGAPQVARGILGLRREVAVGPRDVHTGEREQRLQDLEQVRQGAQVREVVTRVDHEVRAQCGERVHEALLGLLPGHGVQVGDVQDPHGPGALREHTHRLLAQLESTPLPE